MAYAPSHLYPIREGGSFVEKSYGKFFEYDLVPADHSTGDHAASVSGYPHRVWVSENPVNDSGWRYALVKKTVAYIVTDEADDGSPVVKKWFIKGRRIYDN
jgi:hypothetical protein